MYEEKYNNAGQGQLKDAHPMSRLDAQVETLKGIAGRINGLTAELGRHVHTLGFFPPPQQNSIGASDTPRPVVTNVNDAIVEVDRAVDNFQATLHLFN